MLHKDLVGADLHVTKLHAPTHLVGGTDPLGLAESEITGLVTDLGGKAPVVHAHVKADITDFPSLGTAAALNVDADIATLSLPANTTISAAGAELVNDADAAAQRVTLGAAASADSGSKCLTAYFGTDSVTAVSTYLSFAIAASEVWSVDVYGTCQKDVGTNGLKFAVAAPASCTIAGFQLGGGATLAAPLVPSLITAINTLGTVLSTGDGVVVLFELHFRVANVANAGSITIQIAAVTDQTAFVGVGTIMNYRRTTQV